MWQMLNPFSVRRAGLPLSCIMVLLLLGCVSPEARRAPGSQQGADSSARIDGLHWWHVRFRFSRLSPDQTNSYLDGLVAVEVMAPVLDQIEAEIAFWRFHRRWPEDEVGHQFSFLFYGAADTAQQVEAHLNEDPLLQRLRRQGYLREWFVEASRAPDGNLIASTSDDRWPPELQREWPHFIMGASRMWLGLLQDALGKRTEETLHARYREVERELEKLWYREAGHALFHHLNALFGYRPMHVHRLGPMRF